MHRYFVTGTDTDVGKTRLTAGLALALRRANHLPTIVKLVQTGVGPDEEGDAQHAGRLAGVRVAELARFERAADPWSAALAHNAAPVTAGALAAELDAIEGPVVAEGSGGIFAPLNAGEHLGIAAAMAGLETVVAIGMRLGCLNHTLLTLEACRALGLAIGGGVLIERWGGGDATYRAEVLAVLAGRLPILGILKSDANEERSVREAAKLFEPLVNQRR